MYETLLGQPSWLQCHTPFLLQQVSCHVGWPLFSSRVQSHGPSFHISTASYQYLLQDRSDSLLWALRINKEGWQLLLTVLLPCGWTKHQEFPSVLVSANLTMVFSSTVHSTEHDWEHLWNCHCLRTFKCSGCGLVFIPSFYSLPVNGIRCHSLLSGIPVTGFLIRSQDIISPRPAFVSSWYSCSSPSVYVNPFQVLLHLSDLRMWS